MTVNIAHLYPDLLNLYGDKGNILSLKYRLLWRGIEAAVREYKVEEDIDFENTDIIYIGGGTDKEQTVTLKRLLEMKEQLVSFVENGGTVIGVCGGYHILGKQFVTENETLDGLGILNITTKKSDKRYVGNVILDTDFLDMPIVGFENHSTVTETGDLKPLGKVTFGNGVTEGVIYKNVLGTNLHGPLLPKNPKLCDYILQKTLENKNSEVTLTPLNDDIENDANNYIINRFIK